MKKDNWFTVDAEGFKSLQLGREPWQLVKELVANAWDEDITQCEVTVNPSGPSLHVTCSDDSSKGFMNLEDARMFFRRTPKRENPNVRGRFNLGEKEVISVSNWTRITTMCGTLSFNVDGSTSLLPEHRTDRGTDVEMMLPFTSLQGEEIVRKLRMLLPPDGVKFLVNREEVKYLKPKHSTECFLETVLEVEEGFKSTVRKTKVFVHDSGEKNGWVFEMGIPVVELDDCPYLIDVQQKVPLSPNRDSLRPAYQKDLLSEVLNLVAKEIPAEQISSTWVRQATEDERVKPEVLKEVQIKRWGDKVALWSMDPKANEKALESGYQLVHGRTLSSEEREQFQSVGVVHASKVFPTTLGDAKIILKEDWTKPMWRTFHLFREVGSKLLEKEISVEWVSGPTLSFGAWYGDRKLTLNKPKLSWASDEKLTSDHLSILVHELSHDAGGTDELDHDVKFQKELERLSGKMTMLSLENPELFKWW